METRLFPAVLALENTQCCWNSNSFAHPTATVEHFYLCSHFKISSRTSIMDIKRVLSDTCCVSSLRRAAGLLAQLLEAVSKDQQHLYYRKQPYYGMYFGLNHVSSALNTHTLRHCSGTYLENIGVGSSLHILLLIYWIFSHWRRQDLGGKWRTKPI